MIMDSSRCNRISSGSCSDTNDNNDIRNVVLVESSDLKERLHAAALFAEKESKTQSRVSTAVVIENHSDCSIIVDEISSLKSSLNKNYFIVYKTRLGEPVPLFKAPVDKYRYVYFKNLTGCRIFVKTKLLKVFFHNCSDSQISLKRPIIGSAEFFGCKYINLNIRISEDNFVSPVPLTRIEMCRFFNIFQSNDCLAYLVSDSVDVSGTIVDYTTGKRESRYELGKIIWDNQEQLLICLSRSEGFAYSSYRYSLHDIDQTIISLPPNFTSSSSENQINPDFGTTPPLGDAWKIYLSQKN